MLLISRGVQDEDSLKEHLGMQYSEKKKLIKEMEEQEGKLNSIRGLKQQKLLKSLNSISYPIKDLTHEELAVFIKEIIVRENKLL